MCEKQALFFLKIYFKKFGGLKTSLKFYNLILLEYGKI